MYYPAKAQKYGLVKVEARKNRVCVGTVGCQCKGPLDMGSFKCLMGDLIASSSKTFLYIGFVRPAHDSSFAFQTVSTN
jgi:hypothetical protein